MDYGAENDLSANFASLLQASERKNPFDQLIGSGEGLQTLAVTALPQGTTRKHNKGYEEVIIPPTAAAQLKPGEKLVPDTCSMLLILLWFSSIFIC